MGLNGYWNEVFTTLMGRERVLPEPQNPDPIPGLKRPNCKLFNKMPKNLYHSPDQKAEKLPYRIARTLSQYRGVRFS